MRSFWIGIFASLAAGAACAGDQLETGAPPAWVRPYQAAGTPVAEDDDAAAIRVILMDQQYRFEGGTSTQYIHTRQVVQSPQALPLLGSLVIPWNPAHQSVTVHAVHIIRGDRTIDALQGREFTTLRREANLESAVLDGVLTATLQLDDLRVGDTLEAAYSVQTRIAVLGQHAELVTGANLSAAIDRYRLRASWPSAQRMRLRATEGWDAPAVRRRGSDSEFEIDLTDLEPLLIPQDAPNRFHQVRQLEVTDYAAWSDISAVFAPLYERASTLEPDSPLHARVAEIRATSSDPKVQAAAALRLVQDEVRYLALAMGEGGLTPATADETWRRRLGDCKAKTALLLALLRELGVTSRGVLVSTADDALDRRLPVVGLFDHIIVEAEIDGRAFWLDGTRTGDRRLETIPTPHYGWVLPVTPGAQLLHVEETPPVLPLREFELGFDASAGLYAPAPMTGSLLQRGDAASALQAEFALASAGQRDAYMRQTWMGLIDDLEIADVRSAYDREKNEFRMTVSGQAKLDWISAGSRRLEIPLSRISWSAGEARDPGPYQDLPWTTNFPAFTRFRTTVTLPADATFALAGEDIEMEAARYAHTRRTRLDGAVVVMERETRSLAPEMTEADRAAAVAPLDQLKRKRAEIVAPFDYATTEADSDALDAATPRTAAEMVTHGRTLSSSGRPQEAIAAFDAAIAQDPTSANAYANRGIVKFWAGDLEGAKADFETASAIDPAEWVAMNGRGLMALREERFAEAVASFSDVLALSEDEPFALRMRAAAYASLKDTDHALVDIRRLQAVAPEDAQAPVMEIGLLVDASRLPDAVAAADALAARKPQDMPTLRIQADVREEAGAYADAETVLNAALELEPGDLDILLARADVRAKRGDLEGARADMTQARQASPEDIDLLNTLCWTRAVSGFDLDQALSDCDAALAEEADNAAIIDSRAFVLLQLDRAEEALAAYEVALAAAPRQIGSRYGRGLALLALGRTAEGQEEIDAALAVNARAGREYRLYEARRDAA